MEEIKPWILAATILVLFNPTTRLVAQNVDKPKGEKKATEQFLQYTQADHLLDGITFEYFYKEGGGLEIAFYGGKLKFEWISGPRKGNSGKDKPYQSRMIGDDVFIVNWHETDKPDFVTLIIDLKQNALYSSAILRYGKNEEMIHFKEASIRSVNRPKQ